MLEVETYDPDVKGTYKAVMVCTLCFAYQTWGFTDKNFVFYDKDRHDYLKVKKIL